ncbi:hypothetical protein llap_15113 [Limosa lapponica baueri]|uniref:Uncharacterized protein n=1 Tax=Limosa lapponica baueri TaxID=1758121 RepID=A0A2I0TL81_LIMLA|nr:hypothetical protein llap_15113 [Limosa lapponica baueri]
MGQPEVTLHAPIQPLALCRAAGPAATVEIITTGQKVLAGESQGQAAWGQYGGLQQFCHKELVFDASTYATETKVEYVILKTSQPTGSRPPSWCPHGSSQVLAESESPVEASAIVPQLATQFSTLVWQRQDWLKEERARTHLCKRKANHREQLKLSSCLVITKTTEATVHDSDCI